VEKINLRYSIEQDDQPLVAIAIHNGHQVRDEAAALFVIDDASRLQEEDPFTGEWTAAAQNRIIVDTSRFEVDLNHVREETVYVGPQDAWRLTVWQTYPDSALID